MFVKNKKYKGFTLIEMVVAIFIFSLIITSVVGTFVSVVSLKKKTNAIQRNTENARFAMEQMAKTLRTSSIISFTSINIKSFDYSQGTCIEYDFSINKLQTRTVSPTTEGVPSTCLFSGIYAEMINDSLKDAKFAVIKSASAPPTIGKATIALQVCADSTCAGADRVNIQTTVSLRDYQEIN